MQEKLFSMLKDVLKSKPNVDVVKLQKSGGVVTRQGNVRKKARHYRIKVTNKVFGLWSWANRQSSVSCGNLEWLIVTLLPYILIFLFLWYTKANQAHIFSYQEYFYGLSNDFSPHSNTANFSDLSIYRVGGGPQAPRSALPIGAEPAADPTRLVHVTISKDMHHAVLAVSFAKEPDQIISRYGHWSFFPIFSRVHVITSP